MSNDPCGLLTRNETGARTTMAGARVRDADRHCLHPSRTHCNTHAATSTRPAQTKPSCAAQRPWRAAGVATSCRPQPNPPVPARPRANPAQFAPRRPEMHRITIMVREQALRCSLPRLLHNCQPFRLDRPSLARFFIQRHVSPCLKPSSSAKACERAHAAQGRARAVLNYACGAGAGAHACVRMRFAPAASRCAAAHPSAQEGGSLCAEVRSARPGP